MSPLLVRLTGQCQPIAACQGHPSFQAVAPSCTSIPLHKQQQSALVKILIHSILCHLIPSPSLPHACKSTCLSDFPVRAAAPAHIHCIAAATVRCLLPQYSLRFLHHHLIPSPAFPQVFWSTSQTPPCQRSSASTHPLHCSSPSRS